MKRKLLFAAMFIASALGLEVRAQQWQASAPQDGGTYYLYNVGKGGFLIGNDGRGHVALEPIAGQTITLQADGDNFRIDTHALRNNGGTNQWMVENWDDDYVYIDVAYGHNMHMPWKFTEVTGKPGIYYITIVGGTDNGRYLELDSRDNGSKSDPKTRSTGSSGGGAEGFPQWMLVKPADYEAAQALRVDFTSKVATAWNSWTGASGKSGSVTTMTGTTTPLAELYNSSSAGVKMQQTVTGLDNGFYEVRVFASSHNARGEAGASLNGITRDLANVFATSGESNVTKQIVARGVNDGFVGDEQTYPYTMHDVMVKDGTMTIGLNLATAGQTGWHTIQIYSLVKTGDLPLDDKIAAYEAARDAAQAKLSDTGVAPGYLASIQSTLDTYASVSHTDADALDEATAALNAVNTKAEESRAPYARYNYLKGLTLAIDDDTSAFTPTTNAIDVSEADAAVAEATTVEGIMNAIPLLRQAALTFVNSVTVTLGKTLDLTVLVQNFDFEEENLDVWTATGEGTWRRMAFNDGFGAEFYHGTRNISQTLTGLPEGSYTATVQVTWRDAQTSGLYLTTAAGTVQTVVEQAYNKGSVEGELAAMSDDASYARIAVSNAVTDGSLTLGLKEKASGDGNCWTLFDNFRLSYAGIDYSAQEAALAAAIQTAKDAASTLNIPTAMKAELNATETSYTAADIEATGTYAEVIQAFNDAIGAINTLVGDAQAAVAPYAAFNTLAQAMMDIADQDVYSGAEDEYSDLFDAAADIETATTAADIAVKETALRSAFAAFLTAADIDNGKYFDLTGLIVNAGLDQEKTGWTGTTPNAFSESCAEFFNMDFDFYQTLPNMPAGNYELHVQAFQRPGSNDVADPAFAAGNNAVNAFIYVNTGQTTILNVMAQTSPTGYFLGDEAGVGPHDYQRATGGYVPNGMTGAHRYFEAGFYENTVLTGIEAGDLKFGFKCDGHPTDAWTIFDNFRLYYYGNSIAVTLDEDVAFSTVSDIEHADVTLHRTFNDEAWNTLVLPFDMAPQQIDEVFGDNVQVAEYVGTEATEAENMYNLVFSKKTTDGITANVPVMIYGVTKAQDDLYTIEDVTIKVPTSLTKADPEGRIDFVGNYTPGMALQLNDFFIASDNNFYKKTEEYNTSVTLKSLRGIFRPIDQPDAVKGIGFVVVEDEATGLNEIQSTKDKVSSTVYDLQGRRVATPAKGLYIMDGKKVMLK